MTIKQTALLITISILIALTFVIMPTKTTALPLIAIANFGPHPSIEASIQGIKQELVAQGFIENKTVRYAIMDVGFDASLIPQMITQLKNQHPKVMVAITTPVAQYAKGTIKDIPLVYSVITDPMAAGLLKTHDTPHANVTGSADTQNLNVVLAFAKRILPHASRVGLLYSTAESNDKALLTMMNQAAALSNMQVVAVPVDEARTIPMAMQSFKNKVDFIYVGGSGTIQPTLPVIAAEGRHMGIPVINFDDDAVKKNMVLASVGVNYQRVGIHAGQLIVSLLKGTPMQDLSPSYPTVSDHQCFLSKKNAALFGIDLPTNLDRIHVIGA